MNKRERKSIKINEVHYEILKDYSESKGISMSESIAEMQRDIDFLKSQSLITISENAKMFCDQVDALAECGRLPEWFVNAIKVTIRPIILQAMLNNINIDFEALRASWRIPANIRLILSFDKE